VKVNLLHVAAGINETELQQIFAVNNKSRIIRKADPIGNYIAYEIVDVSESCIYGFGGREKDRECTN